MNIVFTGGHHNSALIVAKQLKQQGHTIYWFGHKHSTHEKDYVSEEYKDVTDAGIHFTQLNSGKIHRGNPSQWFKFIQAVLFCVIQFSKLKPSIVVAFGGYLAVPAVVAAKVSGIPAVSHEQTTTLGMANKAMLPFLKTLFLTWKDTQSQVPEPKSTWVGLPTPTAAPEPYTQEELKEFFHNTTKPLILISGGKQGAHTVNELMKQALPQILTKYNVFHQAGNNPVFNDLNNLKEFKKTLPEDQQSSYHVVGYIQDFQKIMCTADITIGRSGAHTIYDIIRFSKKMIAIPLPFSYADEQRKNAQKMVDLKLGTILEQETATVDLLLQSIEQVQNQTIDTQQIQAFIKENMPSDTAQKMVEQITQLANK